MKDRLGREIEYLRVSVTQNCNLKCIYCVSEEDRNIISEIGSCKKDCCTTLAPDEFEAIVKIMAELGIKKVRLTGGEPLTRPDIIEIVERISKIPQIEDLSMTTNGIFLDKMAVKLKKAGLKRLNVSLDSLNKDKFKSITGGGRLEAVIDGIKKALEVGLAPVKINTVLIKGVNDHEVDDFIELARDRPVEVRFIELMPIGKYGEHNAQNIVYSSEIIKSHPEMIRCEVCETSQPACYFEIAGFKGNIGFISPMSHRFCSCCNRIRLTCDGKIKPCLGNNGEQDILGILRNHPDNLREIIEKIIYEKPEGHNFNEKYTSVRDMRMIGG